MSDNVTDLSFSRIVATDPNSKGYFVQLMDSVEHYIDGQFNKGRLTGTDYANVYLGSIQYAIDRSIQYASTEIIQNQQAELLYAQTEEVLKSGNRADTALASDEAMKAAQISDINAGVNLKVKQLDILDSDLATATKNLLLMDANIAATQAGTARTEAETDVSVKQLDVMDAEIDLTRKNISAVTASIDQTQAETQLVSARVGTENANTMLVTEQYQSEAKQNIDGGLIDKQIESEAARASLLINQAAVEAKKTVTDGVMDAQVKQVNAEIQKIENEGTLIVSRIATETAQQGLISNQAAKTAEEKLLVTEQIESEKWNNGRNTGAEGVGTLQAQIKLLVAKASTESINSDVMTQQSNLYKAQAEGFKFKQNKEVLKVVTDMWSVRGSNVGDFGISDIANGNAKIGPHSVADLISKATWD